MAMPRGARKAGTGPGSMGGKVKQPKVSDPLKMTSPKLPKAPSIGKTKPTLGAPAFSKGGKVKCKC